MLTTLTKLVRSRRVILLNPDGITVHLGLFSPWLMRWDQIRHLNIYEYSAGGTLGIVFYSLEDFLKHHPVKRFFWLPKPSFEKNELKISWLAHLLSESPAYIGTQVFQQTGGNVLWQGEQIVYPD